MPKMVTLRRIWRDEDGASTVEMGLIISLVAVTALGSMEILGGAISGLFADTGTQIDNVSPAGGE